MIIRRLYSDAELDREIALLKEAGVKIVPDDVHAFRITREYLENMDEGQRAALANMRKRMGPENFRRMIFRILQENEGQDEEYPMHGEVPEKKQQAGPSDETQEVPFSQEPTKTVPIKALGPDTKTKPIPVQQPPQKEVRRTPEGYPIAEPVTVLPTTNEEVIELLKERGVYNPEGKDQPQVNINMKDDVSEAPTVPMKVQVPKAPRGSRSPRDFHITREGPPRYNSDWLTRFISDH